MSGRHYLVVPADLDLPMEIEHPRGCPQHRPRDKDTGLPRRKAVQRDAFGAILCPYERVVMGAAGFGGIDGMFRREPDEHLFYPGTVRVATGRHPVLADTRHGLLRLGDERGVVAA